MNDDVSQGPAQPDQPEPQPAAQSGPQPQPPPPPPPNAGPYYFGPTPPPPPPVMPRRRRNWLIPVSLAIGCLPWLILFVIVLSGAMGLATRGGGGFGDRVALIRVSGTITAGRSGGSLFGDSVAGSEDIVAQLEKARKDDSAKAVLIRINSPGGSAAGSEEVYNEINRVRKSKPVYASMGAVAASGGYYIAAACDKIYADGGTITGSIGVIFETTDMSALFKKIGFSPQVIKSGKYKDMGSPARPMTPEERQLLTGMLMDIYGQFVKAVSDGRQMPVADVKKIADGRIVTGSQAVKLKLVDEIGGMRDATLAVARVAGIKGEPQVSEYTRKSLFESILGADNESTPIRGISDGLLRHEGVLRVK